ncbi:MAG: radical SAM protein [Spirochaetales bacterium]|nr:radical SAM protein [Spirochaetales bacterium]
MLDSYNRNIYYLRLSLTQRCNLSCIYCDGSISENDFSKPELSLDSIKDILNEAGALGFKKLRLTGGEPLVREDIVDIVKVAAESKMFEHIGITTNGVNLAKYAVDLKNAGLSSINISLDTLDRDEFRAITNGNIDDVLAGIEAVKDLGLPIKINMVIFETNSEQEVELMKEFCDNNNLVLQKIRHFNLSEKKHHSQQFDRPPRCSACNRIRVLADGSVRPCLHSEYSIDPSKIGIRAALIEAISAKPLEGGALAEHQIGKIGG